MHTNLTFLPSEVPTWLPTTYLLPPHPTRTTPSHPTLPYVLLILDTSSALSSLLFPRTHIHTTSAASVASSAASTSTLSIAAIHPSQRPDQFDAVGLFCCLRPRLDSKPLGLHRNNARLLSRLHTPNSSLDPFEARSNRKFCCARRLRKIEVWYLR